ncbi:hypothetical protein GBA52_019006 [Prunus armeniaca]|nr:hypothetical protein GBA52_019006 [Prunus armeniaca]
MGDLREDWSSELNGAVVEERPSSASSLSSSPSSLFSSNQASAAAEEGISAEYWKKAEEATQGVIAQVQPTDVSERRRKAVIEYVQRLIRGCLGCEVFPFGSVPLKTYLPDGDIDLTAFGGMNVEEALANDVCSVLEREVQNGTAEFMVKDVQLIRAEVKLVKCLVQNIVVDISFNQLGGLCTLCFLEQVDRLIGKNHLFKRSIILIKAWCYYESRILGAHHGLISTYALETLVLYIFHLFHSSLNGPLAVLYKFLDYFSKFDWDNYCISLSGPVRISSLPELLVETPENGGNDLLLSNDFLKECVQMFSVPSRGYETNYRTFPPKHFNIVDPLKDNNNLGRSVSKGNFYRIRSAFTYGARKLGRILSQTEDNIDDEIRKFFANTLDRHGGGQRPDVQDLVPLSRYDGYGSVSLFAGTESQDQIIYESESAYSSGMIGECGLNSEGSWNGEVTNVQIPGQCVNGPHESGMKVASPTMFSEDDSSPNGIAVSEYRLMGDAKDLATSRFQGLTISSDAQNPSPSNGEVSISPLGKAHHAPHLYFSHSSTGNGDISNGNQDQQLPESFGSADNWVGNQDENQLGCNQEVLSPVGSKHHLSRLSSIVGSSEDFHPSYYGYPMSSSTAGSPKPSNSLTDLSGDHDSHLYSLNYGRWCYECELNAAIPPMAAPPVHSQFQSKKPWDVIRQSVQRRPNAFSQMNANGIVPRPAFYPMNPPMLPNGAGFGVEEMPKPRGTGTYFPNTNHFRDKPMITRGRTQAPVRSPRNNGHAMTPNPENHMSERSSRDLSQVQMSLHKGGGKSVSSDSPSGSPRRKVHPHTNGSMHPSEQVVEFGPTGNAPSEAPGSGRHTNAGSSVGQNSGGSHGSPGMQWTKAELGTDENRIAAQSYRLKDEDDFPPLSV